jgi:hypothetical protein
MTASTSKFKLIRAGELLEMPPPTWLVEGIIQTGALTILYGESGSLKSFTALDLAMCIATDQEWHGRKVKSGPVVYVVGEGSTGAAKRVRAWMKHHAVEKADAENALFLLAAPQLRDNNDVPALHAAILAENINPALIVIDTFARCFVGGEENSAKDVGEFIQGCNELQRNTGAAVLVIHHTGKPKGNKPPALERGSSAIRAAAEAMLFQRRKGDQVTLSTEKQKDEEESKPVYLRLETVAVGHDDTDNNPVTSCVLLDGHGSVAVAPIANAPPRETLLTALRALKPLAPASTSSWRDATGEAVGEPISPKTFDNWRAELVDGGSVEPVYGKTGWYRLTTKGMAFLDGAPSG